MLNLKRSQMATYWPAPKRVCPNNEMRAANAPMERARRETESATFQAASLQVVRTSFLQKQLKVNLYYEIDLNFHFFLPKYVRCTSLNILTIYTKNEKIKIFKNQFSMLFRKLMRRARNILRPRLQYYCNIIAPPKKKGETLCYRKK